MDPIRKAVLFGIGAAAMTKDKIEEFVDQMVKENHLSVEEGKKLFDETVKKASEYSYKQGTELQKTIKRVISEMGLATKADISNLEKKINKKNAVKTASKVKKTKKMKKVKKVRKG